MKRDLPQVLPLSLEECLALGEIGLDQGYWEQAEGYFSQALDAAPDDPRALWGKVRASRDGPTIRECLGHLLECQPDHAEGLAMKRLLDATAPSRAAPPKPEAPRVAAPQSPALAASQAHTVWSHETRPRYGYALALAAFAVSLVIMLSLWVRGRGWLGLPPPESQAEMVATPATTLPLSTQPTVAEGTQPDSASVSPLQRAQLATVVLFVPGDNGEPSRGSGTIVAPGGLVLTNYHVVHTQQHQMPDGQFAALIGLAQNVRRSPSVWYLGVTVATDPIRDLAVLRIVANAETARPLRTQYFETVAIGDSSQLQLGQGIIGMGYPALGGETLTLTRGSMAGFATDSQGVMLGKTDSELLPGSSGGAVLDDDGRLVGVITAAHTDKRTQGRLSYFVLIEQADQMIQQAALAPAPTTDLRWAAKWFGEMTATN